MTKEYWYFSYLKLDSSVVTSCTKTDGKWKVEILMAVHDRAYVDMSKKDTESFISRRCFIIGFLSLTEGLIEVS